MYTKLIKPAILLIGLASLQSCKTSDSIRVNKAKGEMSYTTNSDPSSAIPKAKKSSSFARAKSNLESTAAKKKVPFHTLLNLAQVHLVQGELKKSEDTVRMVLKRDLKNQRAKIILANIYYLRGLDDMASVILNGIGGLKTKNSDVINLMASIAVKKKDYSKALALYKESLKYDTNNVATRMNLGVLFLEYKQLSKAAIQFERVLKITPKNKDAQLHMAIIYSIRGENDKAEDIYKTILSEDENNPVALYNYAVLQENKENHEDALDTLKVFIKQAKNKSAKTNKAFALINFINNKLEASEASISEDELKKMNAKLEQKEKNSLRKKQMAARTLTRKRKKPQVKAAPAKRQKVRKRNTEPSEKNIDELEQMLMQ